MADNKSGSSGMGRALDGEGLSQKKSGGGGRSKKSNRQESDQSVGRKPGEADAPNIPDNVKPSFE